MDDDTTDSLLEFMENLASDNAAKNGSATRSNRTKSAASPAPGTPIAVPMGKKPSKPAVPPAASPQATKPAPPASPSPSPTSSLATQPPTSVPQESPERNPDEQTLSEAAAPLYWFATCQPILNTSCDPIGFLKYRERFLAGCGNPQDPVEEMLIESLVLAFHNAGRMAVQAAKVTDCDTVIAYQGAASRLMAELRRGTLALADYRLKSSDLARGKSKDARRAKRKAGGSKKGKATDSHPKRHAAKKNGSNGKVGSNGNGEMSPWLKKRFEYPIPVESPLDGLIGCGEGI